jgi:probable rRNA maturation factor
MALVVNLQRRIKLEIEPIQKFCDQLRSVIFDADDRDFSVAFVSDRRMTELNSFFRSKGSTTDVLSFPHEPDEFDPDESNLGDIVISVDQAKQQADENGLTLEGEIKQLILHGVLHLSGYDHETDEGEMNRRELQLRRRMKV